MVSLLMGLWLGSSTVTVMSEDEFDLVTALADDESIL
jgi:hypothetical protein